VVDPITIVKEGLSVQVPQMARPTVIKNATIHWMHFVRTILSAFNWTRIRAYVILGEVSLQEEIAHMMIVRRGLSV
jgi:hypothetical protein